MDLEGLRETCLFTRLVGARVGEQGALSFHFMFSLRCRAVRIVASVRAAAHCLALRSEALFGLSTVCVLQGLYGVLRGTHRGLKAGKGASEVRSREH